MILKTEQIIVCFEFLRCSELCCCHTSCWLPPPSSCFSIRSSIINFEFLLPLLITDRWLSDTTAHYARARKSKSSLKITRFKDILPEGYKFFLFLLLTVCPLSVFILFLSSFPDSLTKRFFLRSLRQKGIKLQCEKVKSRAVSVRVNLNSHHFISALCWFNWLPSSPIRSRTAEEACCSKLPPSPPRPKLTKQNMTSQVEN